MTPIYINIIHFISNSPCAIKTWEVTKTIDPTGKTVKQIELEIRDYLQEHKIQWLQTHGKRRVKNKLKLPYMTKNYISPMELARMLKHFNQLEEAAK